MEVEKAVSASSLEMSDTSSLNPLEDRLEALASVSDSDFDLPDVQGVHLLTTGSDAGLYQITIQGYDGQTISLGRAQGIEKASKIHDMIAIALYGCHYPLNFTVKRYRVEFFIDVLLTFQKLFLGEYFWEALCRGIKSGIQIHHQEKGQMHPVLLTYYQLHEKRLSNKSEQAQCTLTPHQSHKDWPPFCPPWMLPKYPSPLIMQELAPHSKRIKHNDHTIRPILARAHDGRAKGAVQVESRPWCDASVTIMAGEAEAEKHKRVKRVSHSMTSKETSSFENGDEEVCSPYLHPLPLFPSHGVVQRRVNEIFIPPKPVVEYDFLNLSHEASARDDIEFSALSRRTRRGRSVRQPARYRDDSIQFSDSDQLEPLEQGGPQPRATGIGPIVGSEEKRRESKVNGSRNVVTLPHVRPIPKLDAARIDEKNTHLTELYRASSHLCHPFLKAIQPAQK